MLRTAWRWSLSLACVLALCAAAGCDQSASPAAQEGEGSIALLAANQPLDFIPSNNYPEYLMPPFVTGHFYEAPLTAIGGSGTGHVWSVVSGTLPAGLFLLQDSPTTFIAGFPTANSGSICRIRVTDSAGNFMERTVYFIKTNASVSPLSISTTYSLLPVATANAPYEGLLFGSGGTFSEYEWSVAPGSTLPAGMSLESSFWAGRIVGAPTTAGDHNFRIKLIDSMGNEAQQDFTLRVVPPSRRLAIDTAFNPAAQAHVIHVSNLTHPIMFHHKIHALGGSGAITSWSIVSGTLPVGLRLRQGSKVLDLVGELAGNPYGSQYSFTLRVTDAAGTSADFPVLLVIPNLPPPPGGGGN